MPSFKIKGLPVLEKKSLKVFTIYGHGGHLGLVTLTIYIYFCSRFPRRLSIIFVLIDQAISVEMFDNGGHISNLQEIDVRLSNSAS